MSLRPSGRPGAAGSTTTQRLLVLLTVSFCAAAALTIGVSHLASKRFAQALAHDVGTLDTAVVGPNQRPNSAQAVRLFDLLQPFVVAASVPGEAPLGLTALANGVAWWNYLVDVTPWRAALDASRGWAAAARESFAPIKPNADVAPERGPSSSGPQQQRVVASTPSLPHRHLYRETLTALAQFVSAHRGDVAQKLDADARGTLADVRALLGDLAAPDVVSSSGSASPSINQPKLPVPDPRVGTEGVGIPRTKRPRPFVARGAHAVRSIAPRSAEAAEVYLRQTLQALHRGSGGDSLQAKYPTSAEYFEAMLDSCRRLMDDVRGSNDLYSTNSTYLRNMVDKLVYQLRNYEPMQNSLLRSGGTGRGGAASRVVSARDVPKEQPLLIVGISTVNRRRQNYLHGTLQSMFAALRAEDRNPSAGAIGFSKRVTIVVLVADVPPSDHQDISRVRQTFAADIASGQLRLVTRDDCRHQSAGHNKDATPAATLPHPEMRYERAATTRLAHRWGDDTTRVRWRSKQVLDVAWLMDYVASNGAPSASRSDCDLHDFTSLAKNWSTFATGTGGHPAARTALDPTVPLDVNEPTTSANERRRVCGKEDDSVPPPNWKPLYGTTMGAVNSQSPHVPYFLMMEDDIDSASRFASKMRTWVDTVLTPSHVASGHRQGHADWAMASFYNPWPVQDLERLPPYKFFGVIGQLFRMHDLPVVVEFLRRNFDQSPLDWLFVDYLKKFGLSIVVHSPSLFQHRGVVSSLEGKEQSGRSVDFDESP